MLDGAEEDLLVATDRWLADFEQALGGADPKSVESLFHPDGYWRDLLAFTWHVQTVGGAENIAAALQTHAASAAASGFKRDEHRTPPRRVTRAGTEIIEAIICFETAYGKAEGVLRLVPNADQGLLQAWTLLTALDQIAGFEEATGTARPSGESYSRDFHGPNWLDQRQAAIAYGDREPEVLVVGGGQAGLSIAARLTQLGVDTLIIDRGERVGDNWRKRYHALTLHNQVHVNHLPYLPFPPNWPTYIPKDKIASWFEAYAEIMELNFWTGTEFGGAVYDAQAERWSVELKQAVGKTRQIHPRHIVMATGVSGIPNLPDIASLPDFAGAVMHSSGYDSGEEWAGRNVIILGTGNSGHDIAQDL
ncbi:MAG: hypothetical protein ACI8S3_002580, partial [Alphaproteobacteria bacterium]